MYVRDNLVNDIRTSSRQLVRQWGVLAKHVAGTDYSLSAVHAVLEIGLSDGIKSKDLAHALILEKSTISRLVKSLVEQGLVVKVNDKADRRQQGLSLSESGKTLFEAINLHANEQVRDALDSVDRSSVVKIVEGLWLYANALGHTETAESPQRVEIKTGYRAGLIGQISALHSQFYFDLVGFGAVFEAIVASGMSEFAQRLDKPCNQFWYVEENGKFLASLALDGEDIGDNIAHLRWFIVDSSLRGRGVGRQLFSRAVAFADEAGFKETHLSTFKGLDAARHIYESYGFELVEEKPDTTWGKEVIEQQFARKRAE
ncbi:transcriptional regulator, MarR family with acetyltransferase activity [Cohaesibacter marisflavi]|uniref:Transcriptional regulator, MarR family with acetyltransferase activity n=1 Tax=Cohaesibacter marisflavi TaxID=655353 RepID=A0A1I5JSW4_9HYPH|nr:helix-turn-helix domain-containing GNAT family N-acetyltransferase [Cohaesibacter marisflavi]SFO75583.1 transcriptional regulator, MarR family with acetyltransferase activity [Cohaesibacter marisflavi]